MPDPSFYLTLDTDTRIDDAAQALTTLGSNPPEGWLAIANLANEVGTAASEAQFADILIREGLRRGQSVEDMHADGVLAACEKVRADSRTLRELIDAKRSS